MLIQEKKTFVNISSAFLNDRPYKRERWVTCAEEPNKDSHVYYMCKCIFNRYIREQLILTINWWVFIFCKIHVHWTYCITQINTCTLDRCLSVMILIHASWLHLLCSRLTTGVFTFMLLHAPWYKNRKQTKAFGNIYDVPFTVG